MASEIKVNTIKDLGGNTIVSSNGSGTITGLPASAISSGTVATARLGSGTASSSTFLAGDSSYKTVSGTTINNNADNRVITGSGTANTLEGESALTFSSPSLKNVTASSGATASGESDELVLEGTAEVGMSILSATSGSGSVFFGDSGANGQGRLVYYHGDDSMRFVTNSSERMRIDSAGVAKVNNRLVIDNEVNSASKLNIEFGGNAENGQYFNDKDGASNARYVGFERGGTFIGQIKRDGTNDSISYVTSSDYRLKDGVVDKTDGIEKIKLLKPRKFYWKSNTDKTLVDGFLAHEVSDIVPEAISGEKDAMIPEVLYTADDELPEGKNIGDVKEATKINPQGIDQSKLVPLLTSALQEAITKIETLEVKVATLESA